MFALHWGLMMWACANPDGPRFVGWVDVQRAVEQHPAAFRIRTRIAELQKQAEGRVEALKKTHLPEDPAADPADWEMGRQLVNHAIERMEEELSLEQERLLEPLLRQIRSRMRTLEARGWHVLDSTFGQVMGLPAACDHTAWASSTEKAPPNPDPTCRVRGLAFVHPDVAYGATAEARKASRNLDALKAKLEAQLAEADDPRSLRASLQEQLHGAEREVERRGERRVLAVVADFRVLQSDWAFLLIPRDRDPPQKACNLTGATYRALSGAAPKAALQEGLRGCAARPVGAAR